MRRAKLLHVTPSGFVVALSLGGAPRGDSFATDPRGNVVGDVVDVFGPVSSPYLLIKPSTEKQWEEGIQLFLYPKAPHRGKGMSRRRRFSKSRFPVLCRGSTVRVSRFQGFKVLNSPKLISYGAS